MANTPSRGGGCPGSRPPFSALTQHRGLMFGNHRLEHHGGLVTEMVQDNSDTWKHNPAEKKSTESEESGGGGTNGRSGNFRVVLGAGKEAMLEEEPCKCRACRGDLRGTPSVQGGGGWQGGQVPAAATSGLPTPPALPQLTNVKLEKYLQCI